MKRTEEDGLDMPPVQRFVGDVGEVRLVSALSSFVGGEGEVGKLARGNARFFEYKILLREGCCGEGEEE